MPKTIQEINEKIKKGEAVVLTAEEIIDCVAQGGVKKSCPKSWRGYKW
jgi:L-aspartate semialdehyde sulfurtransferase